MQPPAPATPPLAPELTEQVLAALNIEPRPADAALLTGLVSAYTRRIPWESASRITKRQHTPRLEDCPRWPAEFWQEALLRGTGGTCFESNYAFFSLLISLGYTGYLTINDMGEQRACHTAIRLQIAGEPWLADVGIPLYAPLRLVPGGVARQESSFHAYTISADGEEHYQVERDRHLQPYIFTLIDSPVDDAYYRQAATQDYGSDGRFLDRVVITKVVGRSVWRFNHAEIPLHLEIFQDGQRLDHPLDGEIAAILADIFTMDVSIIRAALDAVRP